MTDQWTDRLSEYLDDELGAVDRAALTAHLRACAACRATLAELERVVARAAALADRPPAGDLWSGVAQRIGLSTAVGTEAQGVVSLAARRARRRFAFTVPQLAAAAIALMLLSSGTAWLATRRGTAAPVAVTPRPSSDRTAVFLGATASPIDAHYAAQVADLERALARGRGQLDTATVHVIEKNLAIIDRAIRDAQSALAADPANAYLNLHLADEMRRKLELLRQAALLAGARS